jgi:cysteinyl-tRNA synthetase
MLEFDKILGLEIAKHASKEGKEIDREAKELIDEREQARKEKDFKKADEIRKTLKEKYRIILEDTKDGVRWHFENP